ncbi:MAG TPA: DUF6789 family protein [Gemmatimonadales bacterium]|nr:DUF6789 family protein [Gemmatimonadales bacterium]
MTSRLWSGVLAGLAAGVVFGVMMQIMQAPTPDGGRVPVMQMVAMVVRSDSIAVGWLYHLFNSAVLGGLFAWLFGSRLVGYGAGFTYGAIWGVVWWVLGGLLLMPVLLGMPAFAPLRMAPMRGVAMGSLIGHLIYGLILGGVFVRLSQRVSASRV